MTLTAFNLETCFKEGSQQGSAVVCDEYIAYVGVQGFVPTVPTLIGGHNHLEFAADTSMETVVPNPNQCAFWKASCGFHST